MRRIVGITVSQPQLEALALAASRRRARTNENVTIASICREGAIEACKAEGVPWPKAKEK